jgi:hypothetical protein
MNNAVNNGGKELQKFAKLSWKNAEEFAHIWKTDASRWFELFVNGLWNAWDDASNILWELVWMMSDSKEHSSVLPMLETL